MQICCETGGEGGAGGVWMTFRPRTGNASAAHLLLLCKFHRLTGLLLSLPKGCQKSSQRTLEALTFSPASFILFFIQYGCGCACPCPCRCPCPCPMMWPRGCRWRCRCRFPRCRCSFRALVAFCVFTVTVSQPCSHEHGALLFLLLSGLCAPPLPAPVPAPFCVLYLPPLAH